MNTKTNLTTTIITANAGALLLATHLIPILILPTILMEGLFVAVVKSCCGTKKTLMYYSLYNLAVTVQLCFCGGFVTVLVFAGGVNLFVLPVLVFCANLGYAWLAGYLVSKRCCSGWGWVEHGVR